MITVSHILEIRSRNHWPSLNANTKLFVENIEEMDETEKCGSPKELYASQAIRLGSYG